MSLDLGSGTTLQLQAFEQIRRFILNGQLKPGMMLPSTRQLSQSLKISRNTVSLVYERLAAEGYIEARGRAGSFVSVDLPKVPIRLSENENVGRQKFVSPLLCFSGHPPGLSRRDSGRPCIDFWVGRSDPSTFPVAAWRRILLRKLAGAGANLTEYGEPAGVYELRAAIASQLARTRGMHVASEQVVITSGSQDGLNLICRLVDLKHHPVFIENPCYQGAALLFESMGAQLHPIPVDQNGIVAEMLPRSQGGILFVTPSHQYPLGCKLSLERRLNLIGWAERTNSVIIEDDYDNHFTYDGPPITALAGLGNGNHVFYLGTFSKSLGAGIRLGFTVVPLSLVQPARIVKSQMDHGEPWLEQVVLAEFLESGLYDRHLRNIRKLYRERRDFLRASIVKNFGTANLMGADGGLHFVWHLPHGAPPAEFIADRARRRNVGVYTLSSGAAHDFGGSPGRNALVFGYSSVKESDIEIAIGKIREIFDEYEFEKKIAVTAA